MIYPTFPHKWRATSHYLRPTKRHLDHIFLSTGEVIRELIRENTTLYINKYKKNFYIFHDLVLNSFFRLIKNLKLILI